VPRRPTVEAVRQECEGRPRVYPSRSPINVQGARSR